MRYVVPRLCWLILLFAIASVYIAQEATEEPTVEPTVLEVWIPDVLLPSNRLPEAIFNAQTNEFLAAESNVEITIRRRRVGAVGGIMSTLQPASVVAPDALPALTLLRRQDLITAQQLGLIQSLEGQIQTALTGDLGSALALGQIEGELYGLPYALELSHLLYQSDDAIDDWSFDAITARETPFLFPAGAQSGISNTVLLQYLAAGGRIDGENSIQLNEDALLRVLTWYETLAEQGLLDEEVLNFTTPQDYLPQFIAGDVNQIIGTSTIYLNQANTLEDLRAAPIPTASGEYTTILDGWMWVLISNNADVREMALRYMLWMEDAARQSEFTEQAGYIPALESAFVQTRMDDFTRELYRTMLGNALIIEPEVRNSLLARGIQDALIDVLSGEQTAEVATSVLIAEFAE